MIKRILKLALRHRTIEVNGEPYLTRYYLPMLPGGVRAFLHHFHQGDDDRGLHNHPWEWSASLILRGGYCEIRQRWHPEYDHENKAAGARFFEEERVLAAGAFSMLLRDTFHRVALLDHDQGCWTLFLHGPRVQDWGFLDDDGQFTPWQER